MNFFHPHSPGFKDGRKEELFPPLVALSSLQTLLAPDKTMEWGPLWKQGKGWDFSIWDHQALGGRARWNYGLSVETKRLFKLVLQTRIGGFGQHDGQEIGN